MNPLNSLLSMAIVNALTVIPLAGLVLLLARLVRNSALRHTLWVLVLLKFVTPPLFSLPLTIALPTTNDTRDVERPAERAAVPASSDHVSARVLPQPTAPSTPVVAVSPAASPSVDAATVLAEPMAGNAGVPPESSSPPTPPTWWRRLMSAGMAFCAEPSWWRTGLLWSWVLGTLVWTLWQLWHAARFARLVAQSPLVPSRLQEETNQLAANLGLAVAPRVSVIDAPVSPMLWGCGRRARLLFPADLANRLDAEARATLLAHELAHFQRGDHGVRLLEFVATAVFWWHPVLWWCRTQIEQSEEECCDAWVVQQFPQAPRRYAEALLDTIDYLCETRRALPPIASGLGQAPFLRRRLTRIMQGTTTPPLSRCMRCGVGIAALAVLPLQPFVFGGPTLGQRRIDLPRDWPPASVSPADESPDLDRTGPAGSPDARQEPAPAQVRRSPTKASSRPQRRGSVWSTAVSPDGRFVIRITTSRRVTLTDLAERTETDLSDQNITAVAFAPDQPWFVAAGSDGRITLWNSLNGTPERLVARHPRGLRSVAVSPAGDAVAAGSLDGQVLVCDLGTGEVRTPLPTLPAAVNCVRFSPHGRSLAVASGDWVSGSRSQVVVHNLSDGEAIATLKCETAPGAVAFASNEELIVGLYDGRAQLWNLATRQVVAEAKTDKGAIDSAAFSADNPALREIRFSAVEPAGEEWSLPLSVLRGFLDVPSSAPVANP